MLDVDAGASSGQLRSAYRQAARRWHPDKWATATRCACRVQLGCWCTLVAQQIACRVEQEAAAEQYSRVLKAYEELS